MYDAASMTKVYKYFCCGSIASFVSDDTAANPYTMSAYLILKSALIVLVPVTPEKFKRDICRPALFASDVESGKSNKTYSLFAVLMEGMVCLTTIAIVNFPISFLDNTFSALGPDNVLSMSKLVSPTKFLYTFESDESNVNLYSLAAVVFATFFQVPGELSRSLVDLGLKTVVYKTSDVDIFSMSSRSSIYLFVARGVASAPPVVFGCVLVVLVMFAVVNFSSMCTGLPKRKNAKSTRAKPNNARSNMVFAGTFL